MQKIRISCIVFVAIRENLIGNSIYQLRWRFSDPNDITRQMKIITIIQFRHRRVLRYFQHCTAEPALCLFTTLT